MNQKCFYHSTNTSTRILRILDDLYKLWCSYKKISFECVDCGANGAVPSQIRQFLRGDVSDVAGQLEQWILMSFPQAILYIPHYHDP